MEGERNAMGMGDMQKNKPEAEFSKQYNQICGRILKNERMKRNISKRDLSCGLLSTAALDNLEDGSAGWTKLTGDMLMLRMGISPGGFEITASSDELDRWRMREDICLLAGEDPAGAGRKLIDYRGKYRRREPAEEQFLLKAEGILAFFSRDQKGDALLKISEAAVSCTVPDTGAEGILGRPLAPAELDAFLLKSAALASCGRMDEAWEIWQAVWRCPHIHSWEPLVSVRILPQAAVLGIELALRRGSHAAAFAMGREALELLRRCRCHCYALPLLERFCRLPARTPDEEAYLAQAVEFRDAFRLLYDRFHYPGGRLWQGICVENTREAGLILKMLRTSRGLSRAAAVHGGEGAEEMVVTPRELEKIENGTHKPSYGNYNRLLRRYLAFGSWQTAMLETDSAQVLAMRQQISTLISMSEWDEAEREMGRLRRKVNPEYPRVKQEFLFWDALLLKQKDSLEESLALLKEALHITVPDLENADMKYWVFQREEAMIASNIASLYRRMGRFEESEAWFETVRYSLELQRKRTGIPHRGYEILMEGYDNLLGDTGEFKKALTLNEEAIHHYLKRFQVPCLGTACYRAAWNAMQIEAQGGEPDEDLSRKRKDFFRISQAFAVFSYNADETAFLKAREQKYLS